MYFTRDNYDEKWLELCEWFAETMEWNKPPGHYLKAKPKFDDVLKQCGVVEGRGRVNKLVYDLI